MGKTKEGQPRSRVARNSGTKLPRGISSPSFQYDELLVAALSSLNVPIVVVDRAGMIRHVSHAVEGLRDVSRSDCIGESLFRFAKSLDPAGLLPRVLADSRTIEICDEISAPGDKQHGCVSACARPLYSECGGLLGALLIYDPAGMNSNVPSGGETDSVLGEVASHVAHEIRNPLGTIGGFASLLEREYSQDDRCRRWVRKIIEAVGHLDRIVTQLYVYVQPVKAQVRPADLVEKTKEVFEFAEIKFGARDNGVAFDYRLPDHAVHVLMDPHWWQEVVLVICANAVQAMKDGGQVGITILEEEANAEVIVADEGEGIPTEMSEKVFYPFFSSKPDGTGLGLAVARKLLQSMNGGIEIESAPGRGTTVRMKFEKV